MTVCWHNAWEEVQVGAVFERGIKGMACVAKEVIFVSISPLQRLGKTGE